MFITNSIKNLVVILFAFLILPCILTSCATAQKAGGVTEEVVLRAVNKFQGRDLRRDDICINNLTEEGSGNLVVVAVKDEKLVCQVSLVFVGPDHFERGTPEWSKGVLQKLGWEKANWQQRSDLAKLWVEKILYAFSARSERAFYAAPVGENQIKVTVSVQLAPGVTSRHAAKVFVFDSDGNVTPGSNY